MVTATRNIHRSIPAIVAAALLASMAAGAVSQANTAPTLSLSTEPARQVFGVAEPFVVAAAATDDTDPPERLQYRWTVRNLGTGLEQSARSTTLRRVRTSGPSPGNYEYKCIVTDTAGAAAEATLTVSIQNTGAPEVAGLAFDDNAGAFHHVTPYWRQGFPAIRRGEWAVMLVSVRHFIGAMHVLRVFVDGKPVVADRPGAAWAAQNLGGDTTERRVRLFVPPDVAAGRHSIEAAVLKRGADGAPDTEMSRASFAPLVLFSSWRSAPDDFASVGVALEIVAGMPQDARADANRVTAAMAAYVGDPGLPGKPTLAALLHSIGIPASVNPPSETGRKAQDSSGYQGRLFVAGEPALGVATGATVTLTANVLLDAVDASTGVEAQLALDHGDDAAVSIIGDARKATSTLAPDHQWTPSWQVRVNAPGTYRLPVRVRAAGLSESAGDILLVAGGSDPDAAMIDDFSEDATLGGWSFNAIAGVVAVVIGLIGAGIYVVRRRKVGK